MSLCNRSRWQEKSSSPRLFLLTSGRSPLFSALYLTNLLTCLFNSLLSPRFFFIHLCSAAKPSSNLQIFILSPEVAPEEENDAQIMLYVPVKHGASGFVNFAQCTSISSMKYHCWLSTIKEIYTETKGWNWIFRCFLNLDFSVFCRNVMSKKCFCLIFLLKLTVRRWDDDRDR